MMRDDVGQRGRVKLRVFRSDKGDCLLLRSGADESVLIDGGTADAFRTHVKPTLAKLKPPRLDLVYVSHIDSDHIGGILELFRWRAREGRKFPLALKHLWHNGFPAREAIPYALALEKSASILAGGRRGKVRMLGRELKIVSFSIKEAIELQQHLAPAVKLNAPNGGDLMLVPGKGPGKLVRLGALRIRVIGPFASDLEKLRREWNDWLKKNRKKVAEIEKAVRPFALGEGEKARKNRQAEALYATLTPAVPFAASRLGQRSAVTTPNLASLMLLVREGGRSLLLTGDGHRDDLLRGLEQCGALKPKGTLHVNVLKVQHHGSKNNIDDDFCRRITADHYLFCGNGKHQNPHLKVVEVVAASRATSSTGFKFWFNSSSHARDGVASHLKKLEKLMVSLEAKYAKLSFEFLESSYFDLQV